MRRPLTNLSRAVGFLGLLLGAFASLMGALSSIAGDPPHGMGLGPTGERPDPGPVSFPVPADSLSRWRRFRLPYPGFLTRTRLIRWLLGSKKRLTLAAVVAAALVAGLGVFAYFLATGAGNATANVGSLNAPTTLAATAATPNVTVTWDTSTLNNGTTYALSYTVTRYDATNNADPGTAACGGSTFNGNGTLQHLQCTDSPPASGTYRYKITAKFNSWTTQSGFTNSVTVASTTTAVTSSVNPSVTGQSVTYTATVTPGASGTPTGTVHFKDGVATITGCSTKPLSGSGPFTATCTVTSYNASASPRTISAVYSGDTSFAGSTSPNFTQTVNKADTSTTLTSGTNPTKTGQTTLLTATVTATAPGGGTPTGFVEFFDGVTPVAACGGASGTALSGGVATCSPSFGAGASPHSLSAQYLVSADYKTSTSSTVAQTVTAANTSTALTSGTNPSVTGQATLLTATVTATAPGGGTAVGFVEFFDGVTPVAACGGASGTALSGGVATCSPSFTATGSAHSLTATYLATTAYNSSTSSAVSQTVNKANTSTSLTSGTNPSVTGQATLLTGTVTASAPGSGTPSGNIEFLDGATPIAACGGASGTAVNGSGVATCSPSFTATGSAHSLTAQYLGATAYNSSISSAVSQTINAANTSTALTSATNPTVTGQTTLLTGTVTASAPGSGTPSGNIEFLDGATPIAACGGASGTAVNGSGVATCSPSFTATGSAHSLTAKYLATTAYNTSSSSPATSQTVNKASTTTAVVSSGNPSVTGQAVTYTATVSVTAPGAGTPTGNIEFFDVGVAIATCGGASGNPLSGTSATCVVTYASAGSHPITAQYLGDTAFNASAVSAPITQSVNVFAGIDWVNTGAAGSSFSCNYTSITSVTCALNGLSAGDIVKGNIRLVDSSHNAVTNTGSGISVPYTLGGQASGLLPSSPQSIATSSSATPTIQFKMDNGNGKTATLTATVTLNGATYTITLTAKS